MIKSTNSIFQLDYPAKSTLTPIRQSGHGFFAENDKPKKLPKESSSFETDLNSCANPYSRSMWATEHDFKLNVQQLEQLNFKTKKVSDSSISGLSENIRLDASPTEPLDLGSRDCDETNQKQSPFKGKDFLDALFELLRNEEAYFNVTDALNMVYRWELHNNKKFRDKLVVKDSKEEILLFGNVDTITQLSKILVKSVKNYVVACCRSGTSRVDWEGFDTHLSVPQEFANTFNPTAFFDSHLNKIRSTYGTYFSSHERQIQLLTELKTNYRSLFYKWCENCLKRSDYLSIEDILESPIKRAKELDEDLQRLICGAEEYLSPETMKELKSFKDRYSSFLSDSIALVKSQTNNTTNISAVPQDRQSGNHLHISASDVSCRSSDTHFSLSSSRYSDYTNIDTITDIHKRNSVPKKKSVHYDNPTLADCIERFRRVEKHLGKLEKELIKLDLTAILDQNLRQAEHWRKIFEFEPASQLLTQHANVETIYTAYINKIHQQRQDVMLLKLVGFQTHVLDPLLQIRKLCERASIQVGDFKALKKDYMASLMSKDSLDIKMQLVVKHFEELQTRLLAELPIFLQLLSELVHSLLLAYNKCMLDYMESLCGGKRLLGRELKLLASGEREPGDNFDILQMFSSSRFCAKQLIRENWSCHGRAAESRVVRKLFEL
ncbi:LAME_0H18470g1_1 [Lachancea meyersii CBS 8951]|uniref:LAME_0H18470g1_1 n=1 Tax=Lachancea meyersii CBS 8951 TaxID=1266667 RepID=A0A1G4KJ91_9SACH|nr:LAME_0H18470g1_1 [Lachancea meyersii CBS 8951]